eukprot:scaffold9578_cov96-Isochrysis_galbana.AAC.3
MLGQRGPLEGRVETEPDTRPAPARASAALRAVGAGVPAGAQRRDERGGRDRGGLGAASVHHKDDVLDWRGAG